MRGRCDQTGQAVQSDLERRCIKALEWVHANTVSSAGIRRTNRHRVPYPEVSGYYIPTLLAWGETASALSFARWLVSVQTPDGSWSDYLGRAPYTFDTGQALKGLLALVHDYAEFAEPIRAGCEFIVGRIEDSGRVTTPDKSLWMEPHPIPESIHLYALAPVAAAAQMSGVERWSDAVSRACAYYLQRRDLTDFRSMSHFHAYVLEGLVDLGHAQRARLGMEEMAALQDTLGFVPGVRDASWCCSTGLLQYAVVWYKLGERGRARRALEYVAQLQTESGGFYGSYGEEADYHVADEISWAVKFFLDAARFDLQHGADTQR